MGWINNIRLMPKLIGSFVLVALLACLVGGVGVNGLGSLHDTVTTLTGDSVPSLTQAMTIREDIVQAMSATRAIGQTTNASQIAQFVAQAQAARQDALREFQGYFAGIQDHHSEEYRRAVQSKALLQQWAALDMRSALLGAQANSAANAQSDQLSVGPENAAVAPLSANIAWLVSTLQAEVHTRTTDSNNTYTMAVAQLLIILVLAVALAVLLGIILARSIAGGVRSVQTALGSITEHCITSLMDAMAALASNDLTVTIVSSYQSNCPLWTR